MKADPKLIGKLKGKRVLVQLQNGIGAIEATVLGMSPSGLFVNLKPIGWVKNEAVTHWEELPEEEKAP